MRCVRAMVNGRVQGVGYRAWTEARARELGLSGWVRNRQDGRVEATFCGNPEAVQTMLDACKTGPHFASVGAVEVMDEANSPPDGFFIRDTI